MLCALQATSAVKSYRLGDFLSALVVAVLLCCALTSLPCAAQTPRLDLLKTLLPSTYDDSLRPLIGTGQPVVVYLNFRVDLLYAVSSADETFALDFFMTERWVDARLAFNTSTFSLPYGDSLRLPLTGPWKPDTYFFNAIRGRSTTTHTSSLSLSCTPSAPLIGFRSLLLV